MTNWTQPSNPATSWDTDSINSSWGGSTKHQYLLLENGAYLLQEVSKKILLEKSTDSLYEDLTNDPENFNDVSNPSTVWT